MCYCASLQWTGNSYSWYFYTHTCEISAQKQAVGWISFCCELKTIKRWKKTCFVSSNMAPSETTSCQVVLSSFFRTNEMKWKKYLLHLLPFLLSSPAECQNNLFFARTWGAVVSSYLTGDVPTTGLFKHVTRPLKRTAGSSNTGLPFQKRFSVILQT